MIIFSSKFTELISAQNRRPTTAARSLGANPKSTSSGAEFDCPEEFGYYPHPNDCSQYYVCVFGGALLESCTGGLMYSHELQTCDWPRNVGCEVSENTDIDREVARVVPHVQQSHKFRFSSLQAGPSTLAPQPQQLHQQQHQQHQQQQPQHQRQQQQQNHQQEQQHSYQAQVQSIPPPPELRVAPNPVVTSRGQPKLLEQQNIAKVC